MSTPNPNIKLAVDTYPDSDETPQEAETTADESAVSAEQACDADAFMDEEDSEAVAERLRQLGYI